MGDSNDRAVIMQLNMTLVRLINILEEMRKEGLKVRTQESHS